MHPLTDVFPRYKTTGGAEYYLAPEVIRAPEDHHDRKVDSWSLGVVMYVMYVMLYDVFIEPFLPNSRFISHFQVICSGPFRERNFEDEYR